MLQNQTQQNIHNQNTTNRTQASSIAGSPVGGVLSGNNLSYHQRWYIKNKDRVSKMGKIYRKKYFSNPLNKLKRSKYQKEFELKNPEKKEYRYFLTKLSLLKINISFKEYKDLILKQKNTCAICEKKEEKRALTIDHCHKTNKVRGLLCKKCNSAIGFLNDNPDLVLKAYSYLTKEI